MTDKETDFVALLQSRGPMTGKELLEETGMDSFLLWKACKNHDGVLIKTVGRRYLRLDREVEGYARLSPSIKREFHDYTVIGAARDRREITARAEALGLKIKETSERKYGLARNVMTRICESQADPVAVKAGSCCILAGDVVYGMAHTEPRPEISTGQMVNGSDLDIVVVTLDLPDGIVRDLDQSIYVQKDFLLRNPSYREELDYIVKDLATVKRQLRFDDYKAMVASKILNEGEFIYGNRDIFDRVKRMLVEAGIPEKIATLEQEAAIGRDKTEAFLLKEEGSLSMEECMKLFHTSEEKEEFF